MSDISVLGLGLMGRALARALQQAGHNITVWNRSPHKMRPFVIDGATGAANVAVAVKASPVLLVCVETYAVAHSILGTEDVIPHLAGRTLIQLGTGAPREARDSAAWFADHDVTYIDGAILCLPEGVGTDDAQILFAGPLAAYKQVETLLGCLGGDLRYLGENVRAAASLDLAFLCQRIGLILGAVHGALLCKSEDVGVDAYASMFPDGDRVQILANAIYHEDYASPSVTVGTWHAILERIHRQAIDAGINHDFPKFAAGVLEQASSAGHSEEDIAALIEVWRQAV